MSQSHQIGLKQAAGEQKSVKTMSQTGSFGYNMSVSQTKYHVTNVGSVVAPLI